MNRILKAVAAGLACLGACALPAWATAGYTPIVASHIQDASGYPLAAGRVTLFPVNNQGQAISAIAGGSGGIITQTGIVFLVVNGAITTDIHGNTPQAADTALTNPAHICYRVSVTDATGAQVQGPGYGCIQPTGSTPFNLDTAVPNEPLQATVQSGPPGPTGASGAPGHGIDVTSSPYSADNTCTTDATSAVSAAYTAALAQEIDSVSIPIVYFPHGCYLLSGLRWTSDIGIEGDGPSATTLMLTGNGYTGPGTPANITITGAVLSDWTSQGFMRDLTIRAQNKHTYAADELELLAVTGYRLDNVAVWDGGGRGINLVGGTERTKAENIYINTVRWPLLWQGNENHLRGLQINAPGDSGDGFCWGTTSCPGGAQMSNTWTLAQTLVSASATGGVATFVVTDAGTGGVSTAGVSPLSVGHSFTTAGITGNTALNGVFVVTGVTNHSPTSTQYTLTAALATAGSGTVGSATFKPTIYPDRNTAVYMTGANNVLEDGSVKALIWAGCFDAETTFGSEIRDMYCEGYGLNGAPRLNPSLVSGNLPPETTLTASLASAGTSVAVASTLWFPNYVNDPGDSSPIEGRIAPPDYIEGSTAASSVGGGVLKGQWENVNFTMAGDGKAHFANRDMAGSTAFPSSWPPGSLISILETNNYGLLRFANNHANAINPPGPNYAAGCADGTVNVCGEIVGGGVENGLTTMSTTQALATNTPINQAGLDLDNNEIWTNSASGDAIGLGYVKAVGSGIVGQMIGSATGSGQANGAGAVNGVFASDEFPMPFINVASQDGSVPFTNFCNLTNDLCVSTSTGNYRKALASTSDPILGAPHVGSTTNGVQVASYWELADVPTSNPITAWSVSGGVATFTAANALASGNITAIYGYHTGPFQNVNASCTVLSSGLSTSQFEVTLASCNPALTVANGSGTDQGLFGHSQYRYWFAGGPANSGSGAGFGFDCWTGSAWTGCFRSDGNGNTHFLGTLTQDGQNFYMDSSSHMRLTSLDINNTGFISTSQPGTLRVQNWTSVPLLYGYPNSSAGLLQLAGEGSGFNSNSTQLSLYGYGYGGGLAGTICGYGINNGGNPLILDSGAGFHNGNVGVGFACGTNVPNVNGQGGFASAYAVGGNCSSGNCAEGMANGGFFETLTTPASSSATCTAGQFTDDANFHYVCTAANTWKRVALSTF